MVQNHSTASVWRKEKSRRRKVVKEEEKVKKKAKWEEKRSRRRRPRNNEHAFGQCVQGQKFLYFLKIEKSIKDKKLKVYALILHKILEVEY